MITLTVEDYTALKALELDFGMKEENLKSELTEKGTLYKSYFFRERKRIGFLRSQAIKWGLLATKEILLLV